MKWKDHTLFSFYQLFGIRVRDVRIYVNTLICHRVGSAQCVFGNRWEFGDRHFYPKGVITYNS
jgi:hypothetical protein